MHICVLMQSCRVKDMSACYQLSVYANVMANDEIASKIEAEITQFFSGNRIRLNVVRLML